jgi:hypothetical protein
MQLGHKIKESFYREYQKAKGYFFGCSFKIYKETYNKRLTEFRTNFFDAEEIDFIKEELNQGMYAHKFKSFGGELFEDFELQDNNKLEKQILYSLKKRLEYLQQRAKQNGYDFGYIEPYVSYTEYEQPIPMDEDYTLIKIQNVDDIINADNETKIKPLKWRGTELHFTELTKALILSNYINGELTQKEIFQRLKGFFQIDDFNESDKLSDIRKRTKDKTPLINILENSLNSWITNKD